MKAKYFLLTIIVLAVLLGATACDVHITSTEPTGPGGYTILDTVNGVIWAQENGYNYFYDNYGSEFYVEIYEIFYDYGYVYGYPVFVETQTLYSAGSNISGSNYRGFSVPSHYYKIYIEGELYWWYARY